MITPSDDLAPEEWVDFDLHAAAEAVAQNMVRFDRHVANQQGACDTGTMRAMLDRARNLYEEHCE